MPCPEVDGQHKIKSMLLLVDFLFRVGFFWNFFFVHFDFCFVGLLGRQNGSRGMGRGEHDNMMYERNVKIF